MGDLAGKRVIITGASKGIGRAIAERLAVEQCALALMARSGDLLVQRAAACERKGAKARAFVCDVGDAGQVAGQFQAAIDWLGGVDCLVNNAGLGYFARFDELALSHFDEMLSTNLRGPFLCAQAVVPAMKQAGDGLIINLASIAGKYASERGAGYCASKFGLMGMSECMGLDLRGLGIRVSAICPGSVNAPDFRQGRATRIKPEDMIQAEDIAEAVVYLMRQPSRIFIREMEVRVTKVS
ncbi:MAG TPA: SDR family NAD(P)-dependent oxidoreductase [bacterium]|nr:SDR family NAD(P)-dependent oxidoreductase [bacterium]